jgi:flagellar protein FliL
MSDEPENTEEDTEEDEEIFEEAPQQAAGGISKKKLLIIFAAIVVVVIGGSAAVFFLGVLGPPPEGEDVAVHEEKVEAPPPQPSIYHEFPSLLSDLKTGRCRSPFIKLRAVAETTALDLPHIKKVEAEIIDAFQLFLRSQTRKDLMGKEGTERLRRGLMEALSDAIAPAQPRGILFREVLLQ